MTMDKRVRIVLVVISVGLITAAHFTTPVRMGFLHNVYQRLYYLPILAGAFWFGLRGGIMVSLACAAVYLPHIIMDWGGQAEYRQAQYAELIMFQVVGLVVGALAALEKRQRERVERTSQELALAYRRLHESFEQLRRADRLAALGQLSAGLAHEIKNPLASMKGSLEILSSDFPPGHDKREFIGILESELGRLNHVLTEFLQYARTARPDRSPCDLKEIVESIKVLCSREADRHGVTIETSYQDDLPELELDAGQIQQALLNIVLNGIQAMPSGGRLALRVEESSGSLSVWIRDEGEGIPVENRSRIFDPFFTTKEHGTGLGMAIAYNLVQGHGGDIRLLDEEGPGTTFQVVIPSRSQTDD
jgi:two-component system sensor histidine kinase HydH